MQTSLVSFALLFFTYISSAFAVTYPLSIQTENHTTVITHKPERIIVLEFSILDGLKQLNVKPIGIGKSDNTEGEDPAYLKDFIKDIKGVGTRDMPSLEAIAKLKPDLILADVSFVSSEQFAQFNKIAPTILFNGILGTPDEQIENLKTLAKITNNEKKVPNLVEHFKKIKNAAIAAAKQSPEKSILIGYVTPNGIFRALSSNAIATNILREMNRKNLIKETNNAHRIELTVESMVQKNPQQIIVLLTDDDMKPYDKLKSNPLWNDVLAVKEKHVYFMDRNVWAKTHGIEAMEIMYAQAVQSGFLK